jgi:hypothetical protein
MEQNTRVFCYIWCPRIPSLGWFNGLLIKKITANGIRAGELLHSSSPIIYQSSLYFMSPFIFSALSLLHLYFVLDLSRIYFNLITRYCMANRLTHQAFWAVEWGNNTLEPGQKGPVPMLDFPILRTAISRRNHKFFSPCSNVLQRMSDLLPD